MDERALTRLLEQVRSGKTQVRDAVSRLKDLPFAELGYATLDTHRALRFGMPEVVLGESKTVEQLFGIFGVLAARKQTVLVTRLQPVKAESLVARYPKGTYHAEARIFELRHGRARRRGTVAVVTAGTSDIPVAEEAAITAAAMGAKVRRVFDVGVAGIHR
ncbi:MAG TPA: 1-(5-phosphoribosyl)-5-amino-4-imidazole-carboxylate carboxylase, partial [Myxococcaceae bacterium]|nr:1-(5-phosphoribosyl)-5-amino-4-imidazole-carboxylate carboxylase [Myxococcaceae bacterium]